MPENQPDQNHEKQAPDSSTKDLPTVESGNTGHVPDTPNAPDTEPIANNEMQADVAEIKDRVKAAEIWMICLTAAIALFALGSVIVGCLQWNTMSGQLGEMKSGGAQTDYLLCLYRQQVNEMRHQTVATQNLAVGSIDQATAITQSESAFVDMSFINNPKVQVRHSIDVPIQLTNNGKTIAKNVESKWMVVLVERTKDPKFVYPPKRVANFGVATLPPNVPLFSTGPNGLFPGAISYKSTTGDFVSVTPELASDIGAGRQDIMIYGEVTYTDEFAIRHWVKSCHSFDVMSEGIIRQMPHPKCAAYNQTDSNRLINPANKTAPVQIPPEIPCIPPPVEKRK